MNPEFLIIFVASATIATSALSSLLGMGGGMLLMLVLISCTDLSTAMIVHGVIQFTSNGSRAILNYKHIKWKILPEYFIGAISAIVIFFLFDIVIEKKLLLFMLASIPFLTFLERFSKHLNIDSPFRPLACGSIVTLTQLSVGVSGPLLDVFYLSGKQPRHQVIATKALTQTLGHLLKTVFYLSVTNGFSGEKSLISFLPIFCLTTVLGTKLGKNMLDRISDYHFRKMAKPFLVLIAVSTFLKALY